MQALHSPGGWPPSAGQERSAPQQLPGRYRPRVGQRIVAAIDSGFAVHPNAVDAQLQGATVDGISTALGLEITVKDGQIQQSNLHDYPLARIAVFPSKFETHILPYDDTPTGVGEIGIPSAAPALTNANFNATGKRIRRLPIGDQWKA